MMLEMLRQKALVAGVSLHTRGVTNTANKQARIEGLESYISSGKLRFARSQSMLLEQLRHFPLGAHDDGPDALQLCVSYCAERRVVTSGRIDGRY
jgi:predicted phage terminase large subunit-like protein